MDSRSQNDILFAHFHPDIESAASPPVNGFYSLRLDLPIKVEDILESRSASPSPTPSVDIGCNAVSSHFIGVYFYLIDRSRTFMQPLHPNYHTKPSVDWRSQMRLGLCERPSKDWPNVNHTRLLFFSNFIMLGRHWPLHV